MERPKFKNARLALAGALVLTAAAGLAVARSQRIGIEGEGIVKTVKCPHPEVIDRNLKVMLLRFPTSKEPDRSSVELARINDFFRQLLNKNPEGYQIDAISPFDAAPKTTRYGVLNVLSGDQAVVFNYVRKARGIGSFQARISEDGIEILKEEVPAPGRVDSFIRSFFDKNGCEVDHKEVDSKSPSRLYIERIHSLKDYGLDGERKPFVAK